MKSIQIPPTARLWLYRIGACVLAVALIFGWVAPEQLETIKDAALEASVVMGILLNILANKNVNVQ